MTIIKKFEPEKEKKRFPRKYICLVGVGLFALLVAEIWASNNVVKYGEKLKQLSTLSKTLSLENQMLENEIAKVGSLNNIASRSAALGFSLPESIQYIR